MAAEEGRSCGCSCLGCGCLALFLAGCLLSLGGIGAWLFRDEIVVWLGRDAPRMVTDLVEGQVRRQAARPLEFPPLPQSPEVVREVEARVQGAWQAEEADGGRSLDVSEEELNLLLRSWVRRPEVEGLAGGIHDLHVEVSKGRVDLRTSLYGDKLGRLLEGADLPPTLSRLLQGAEFLNLEAGASVESDAEGTVRLRPDSLRVLGMPVPVSLLRQLGGRVSERIDARGIRLPGVRGLTLEGDRIQLRVAPGSSSLSGLLGGS